MNRDFYFQLAVEGFFQEVDAEDNMPVDVDSSPPRERHQPPRVPTPPPAVREHSHKHAKAASGPAAGAGSSSRY